MWAKIPGNKPRLLPQAAASSDENHKIPHDIPRETVFVGSLERLWESAITCLIGFTEVKIA